MSVTAVFILSSLGFAILAKAQDCSTPIGGLHMNLRDDYITKNTFADGSKVYFACAVGYTSAGGSASITCTAGTWSKVQLTCERKSCGALDEVSNGQIDYAGVEFGDTATVTCNPGYQLVGRSTLRCEDTGWSGRLPTCDAVKCSTPADILNGGFDPNKDSYFFGDVVRYSCNKGLVLDGSREITCSDNGNFSPSPPNCVKVECKDPVIENAVFESGSRPPHGHKATVQYSCIHGYRMIGVPSVTCEINNQWSPSLPVCIKIIPTVRPTSTTITTTKQPKGGTSTQAPTPNSRGVTSTQAPTSSLPAAGGGLSPGWITVIVFVLICLVAIIVFFIRKKRSQRTRTVKDPAKDGEDVALS
ncbi:membrane cofactor protein-like isoform X4 [Poeciliopsis prolifica]|uniref:membrane cofactor protein-like isoform X4 n=1 Tax=Poeciliopsis prolifica TaxID=188132 RepID=UPI0024146144|nr:membrane cofactor protein-like isoform X4 [Poeciliopsis prolifica]